MPKIMQIIWVVLPCSLPDRPSFCPLLHQKGQQRGVKSGALAQLAELSQFPLATREDSQFLLSSLKVVINSVSEEELGYLVKS